MKNKMNFTNFAQFFMKNDEKHDEIHKFHKNFHKKDEKSHEFHQKMWKNWWIFEKINTKYSYESEKFLNFPISKGGWGFTWWTFQFPKFSIFEGVGVYWRGGWGLFIDIPCNYVYVLEVKWCVPRQCSYSFFCLNV